MNIVTVKSIEDLKSLPVPIPDPITNEKTTVYVQSYYKQHIYTDPITHITVVTDWEGDGGGGLFLYEPTSLQPTNLGTFFMPDALQPPENSSIDPNSIPGRWIRQYEGHMNVAYFGVTKHPIYQPYSNLQPAGMYPSNSDRIQNAIDYAHDALFSPVDTRFYSDLTLYFQAGTYWIDKPLTLKDYTHIKGDDGTQLWMQFDRQQPNTYGEGPIEPPVMYEYMFLIDKGILGRVIVENIYMDLGYVRINQPTFILGGFLIKAQFEDGQEDKPNSIGGLGNTAVFKDIMMCNVGGHGIRLHGGDVDNEITRWHLCNQYIYFDNIWVERRNENKNCVKMTGLVVNISFTSCQFSIPYLLKDPKKPIERDKGINVLIDTPSNTDQQQINTQIVFLQCASGGSPGKTVKQAYSIREADNITLENCWIEDTENGVYIEDSRDVSILNTRFANAAQLPLFDDPNLAANPLGTQSCCICVVDGFDGQKNHRNSFVTIERNLVASVVNKKQLFVMGIGNNSINVYDNSFNDIRLGETFGVTQYTDIELVDTYYTTNAPSQVTGINTDSQKVVLVTIGEKGYQDILRINSKINAGELLFIRAEEADIIFHSMDMPGETQGRNIFLSGEQYFTLRRAHTATFLKTDGYNNEERSSFHLIATL